MSNTGFITAQGANYVLEMIGGGEYPVGSYFIALTNTVATPYTTGAELDEINASEYARAEYPNVSGAWTQSNTMLTNVFEVDFPVASSQWNTARGWGICDDAVTGRLLWAGPLSTLLDIGPAQQATFAPGTLSINIPLTSWAQSA